MTMSNAINKVKKAPLKVLVTEGVHQSPGDERLKKKLHNLDYDGSKCKYWQAIEYDGDAPGSL